MSQFLSVICIVGDDGLANCEVQISPKGKKYVVRCKPDNVEFELRKLFDKEVHRRQSRLHHIQDKFDRAVRAIRKGPRDIVGGIG